MHFTYASPDGDLKQGDLLQRTPELEGMLEAVHPYYRRDAYTHFLVVTQSCDLVRRAEGPELCAAPYIGLCAVRSLSGVIDKEAQKYRNSAILKIAKANSLSNRERLAMFLKRLLNNNNHEYFYLHEDNTLKITDRLCAYLRLSVALKSVPSYDIIATARIASLAPSFQAKLGWLVANIYGRVGTDDWAPDHYSEEEWNVTVDAILDESMNWFEDAKIKAAEKLVKNGTPSPGNQEEAVEFIAAQPPSRRKEQIIDAVLDDLRSNQILTDETLQLSKKILTNSAAVGALIKS